MSAESQLRVKELSRREKSCVLKRENEKIMSMINYVWGCTQSRASPSEIRKNSRDKIGQLIVNELRGVRETLRSKVMMITTPQCIYIC